MLPTYRPPLASAAVVSFSSSAKPRMLFRGVRSSWLTLARNSLLRRLDSYRATLLSASWPTLTSRALLLWRSRSALAVRLASIVLNVSDSCWNSSPVLMWERMFRSPAATLAAVSWSTRTGWRMSRVVIR